MELSPLSKQRLAGAHPMLQKLFNAVAKEADIIILDSQRGREAQEKAFREKKSKAHFGQSPHNWTPSVALDVAPWPVDWNNLKRFKDLAIIVKRLAKELEVPISHGGDWKDFKDYPHYELDPWRVWARQAKPYKG